MTLIAIVTISDRASRGEYQDLGGNDDDGHPPRGQRGSRPRNNIENRGGPGRRSIWVQSCLSPMHPSTSHEDRQSRFLDQGFGHAAENPLAQPGMTVSTHDHELGAGVDRMLAKNPGDRVI